MVLITKCIGRISVNLLLLALCACATTNKQQVVPVGQASGELDHYVAPSAKSSASNTPQVTLDLIDKAYAAMADQRYDIATQALARAQRLSPREALVYLARGQVFGDQQRVDQAKQMYKRALSLSEPGGDVYRRAQVKLNALSSAPVSP